jgi:GDP-L-fucose synthase
MTPLQHQRILVTGGAGFLGRAVCRLLRDRSIPDDQIIVPRRRDYDLTIETEVARLYADTRPDVVIHLAAEVGGIGANMAQPGRFFFANMAMGLHLVEHGRRAGIDKFVHVGTVCAYPKLAPIPFREEDLWNGYPEPTNAPYGIAKKAIFLMLDAYYRQYGMKSAVLVPVNLYGPGDNFDPETSHVIPALIRKCEEARIRGDKEIVCWGTGKATREFLYVEDAAEGIIRAAERIEEPTPINLGGGEEIAIADLVKLIADTCGFTGAIRWDATKPDGQPRRALDTSRARDLIGWKALTNFTEGIRTVAGSSRP